MTQSLPVFMSDEHLSQCAENGFYQCIVESLTDGHICWDVNDSREREPVHSVSSGERFWCWNFKSESDIYTHDYGNMGPRDVHIETDVKLKLVYMSDNPDDPILFDTELDKSPNITQENLTMEYDNECFSFGLECKERGMDFPEFLNAFNKAYHHNQHALDSAKAGFDS